ncbi:MAG: T9SS type A sorting domain-containing protein [Chitinophagales bacterium]
MRLSPYLDVLEQQDTIKSTNYFIVPIYTVNSGCHTATATFPVTIGGASAGFITGPTGVCNGSAIALAESVSGGVWSASNGNASVTSSGMVTGLSICLDTIIYSVPSTCGTSGTVTASIVISIDALPDPGTITGGANVCVGATMSVADASPGGVWSTTGVYATISPAGIVTGVTGGTDMISYTVTNGCGSATTSRYINVAVFPSAGTITGPTNVCPGSVISLADTAGGGVWSESNGNVSVSMGGMVTGLTAGTDIIRYSISNVCGSAATTQAITIDPLPDAGAITSEDTVCIGGTITLTDAAPGGIWSANNGNASVSGTGIVTGVLPGIVTLQYTVNNSCGTANATKQIDVKDCKTNGISTVATSAIRIFPNPASAILNIEWAGLQSRNANISITDVAGRVALKTELVNNNGTGTMQVNLAGLNEGIYMLIISSDSVYYTDKIVVSKR